MIRVRRKSHTLKEQPGAHRYTPQDFGLDPDEILSRFASYRSTFGLT